MFISYCFIEKNKVLTTRHEIKASPEFETWFNDLTSEEQDDVLLSVYAFYYGVLKGKLDWTSQSATKLDYDFRSVRASPEFLKWFNALENDSKGAVLKRLDRFYAEPNLGGRDGYKEHPMQGGLENVIELKLSAAGGMRIYVSFYQFYQLDEQYGKVPVRKAKEQKKYTDKTGMLCLLFGSKADASSKSKAEGYVKKLFKDGKEVFNPRDWQSFGLKKEQGKLSKS